MRRLLVPLLILSSALIGCPGNNPTSTDNLPRNVHRSQLGKIASPTPPPVDPGHDTGSTSGPGHGNNGKASSDPTLKPGILATDDPAGPLPPGQVGFALGPDTPGVWGNGPYLARPRMAMVAGNVGPAIIVAEGEHRPSLEVFDPSRSNNWLLDDRHDPDAHPEAGVGQPLHARAHGGGLMWAAGGVLLDKNELWVAGGYDGQITPTTGSEQANVFVYREDRGFALDRTDAEGGRTLDNGQPVRAAAGAVIGTSLYVVGGFISDHQAAYDDGTYSKAGTVGFTQVVDIDKHADAVDKAPMPKAVAGAASAVVDGHLYVMGGFTMDEKGKAATVADVQMYDPGADKWVSSADAKSPWPALPVPLHDAAAAAVGRTIYLVGGMGDDAKPVGTMYSLDTNNPGGGWVELPRLPTPRAMLALVPYQDGLWAIGGMTADGQPSRVVEKFFMEIPH